MPAAIASCPRGGQNTVMNSPVLIPLRSRSSHALISVITEYMRSRASGPVMTMVWLLPPVLPDTTAQPYTRNAEEGVGP